MSLVKKISQSLLTLILTSFLLAPTGLAATSILPQYEYKEWNCEPGTAGFEETEEALREQDTYNQVIGDIGVDAAEELLGCALKIGEIRFWMIPYYVIFALQFVINLAGLLVVLMILVGAYYYILGGITDDKEKGKKIITYALGGFVLTLSSWILVNILLLALTR